MEIEVKKNYDVLVFQCKFFKFSFITKSHYFEGNYESNFVINFSEWYNITKIEQNLCDSFCFNYSSLFCLSQILLFDEQDFCLTENTIQIIEM